MHESTEVFSRKVFCDHVGQRSFTPDQAYLKLKKYESLFYGTTNKFHLYENERINDGFIQYYFGPH
jgi:hypothetical protein